jgi:hypothetical protein
MREELEKELRRIAPTFLQEMDCTEMQSCMHYGIECNDGWFNPLKTFCEKVEALNEELQNKVFVAKQIKEKFGDIRVYWCLHEKSKQTWEAAPVQEPETENLFRGYLEELEKGCNTTCEHCGAKGKLTVLNGWYRTLCPGCFDKLAKKRDWDKE